MRRSVNAFVKFLALPVTFLFIPFGIFAGVFTGKILDEEDEPLAGATLRVKGSDFAVTSDTEGYFSFEMPDKNVLTVTAAYVGYLTKETVIRADRPAKNNIIRLQSDPTSLDEVVVTATRTPKSLKDVPVVTRLITADEIKRSDASNIQDLLIEEIPGLEFGYAMTQETSLNMGGYGGNAVLFLVDGERMAGETLDNVDYNRLTLENVGQVELVKGASSALFGANAVGGVVNLITRESKEPWHVNVHSRYNSFNKEWRSGASLNFNSDKWNSGTSFVYNTSELVRLTGPFDTQSPVHNVYGGRYYNLRERLVYRLSENVRFIGRGGYYSRVSDRVTYEDHLKDYTGGLKSVILFDNSQNMELSYSYDRYDKTRYAGREQVHNHDYSNRQHNIHGLYTKTWGVNALTVGVDYMHDYLTSYQFVDNAVHTQSSFDIFAQFDYSPLSWLNFIASVREDYFSGSKNNAVTSRLAIMFKPTPVTVRISYAGGFRAPSLKEMYMNYDMGDLGTLLIIGNPHLKPERSHNFNLSLERGGRVKGGLFEGSYTLTGTGYFNYYGSRITTVEIENPDPSSNAQATMYANQKGVRVTGVDLTGRYQSKYGVGASLSYNYYHVFGRNITAAFVQPRPHSATWKIFYDKEFCSFWRCYAALSGRYLSQPVTTEETQKAYNIWKFTLQQTIWRGINVNFVLDNLFNYKPKVYYYNSPMTTGLSWSIGLSLNINDLL